MGRTQIDQGLQPPPQMQAGRRAKMRTCSSTTGTRRHKGKPPRRQRSLPMIRRHCQRPIPFTSVLWYTGCFSPSHPLQTRYTPCLYISITSSPMFSGCTRSLRRLTWRQTLASSTRLWTSIVNNAKSWASFAEWKTRSERA